VAVMLAVVVLALVTLISQKPWSRQGQQTGTSPFSADRFSSAADTDDEPGEPRYDDPRHRRINAYPEMRPVPPADVSAAIKLRRPGRPNRNA
jgi:hypothetical protein